MENKHSTRTDAQKRANRKYLGKLDEFKIRAPRGLKDTIQRHCETTGESMNGFLLRAIGETITRDNEK